MIPLIDADILRYEIGFAAETGWQSEGVPPFDYAADLLDARVDFICNRVGATEAPILYLTGKGNFRYDIAKKQPYKVRLGKKPYHYQNLTAYIKGKYDTVVTEGIEADDAMALEQTRSKNTIICSRDKDLLQVPGWHFSWELGNQPEFFEEVDEFGWIKLIESPSGKKIKGCGLKFFYTQCITGDVVDSIPGLPKAGVVRAYNLLVNTQTKEEAFEAVCEAYRGFYGDSWKEELLEQGRLLWMTRELDEEGKPILWNF